MCSSASACSGGLPIPRRRAPARGPSLEERLAAREPDPVASAIQKRGANRARAELEALVRHLERREAELTAQVEHLLALADYTPKPAKIDAGKKKRDGRDPVVAVAAASDWHIEERVRPESVSGANEYTPAIAAERAERFFRRFLHLVEINRAGASIDAAILWLGGDLITGYIHEELQEENWLSPTEASLLAFDLIVGGIDYLLERGDFRDLLVACSYGNHGRTTQKTRIASGARNSFEWLLYQQIRRHYEARGESRVRFAIADGPLLYVEASGFVLRCTHGDDFRYQGGVGGLLIPMRKAVAAWQTHRHADATLVGHWHDYTPFPAEIVNGSLIGVSAYGIARVRAPYQEPKQAFFLIHPERRTTVGHFPIFVT